MVAYSVSKKSCANEKDTDDYNKMLRFTAYKSFLNLLELNNLGENRRFGLPACAMTVIRKHYPSSSGKYTRFKASETDNAGNSETLRCF
jgi:hypothetical protein